MDVPTSDWLGDDCYQQNRDLFKPLWPVATIQWEWRGSFPILPVMHTFLPSYPDVMGSNPETLDYFFA